MPQGALGLRQNSFEAGVFAMLYTVNVASQVPNLSARVCAHDLQDCAKNQQAWSTFVSFATLVGQILR